MCFSAVFVALFSVKVLLDETCLATACDWPEAGGFEKPTRLMEIQNERKAPVHFKNNKALDLLR